VDSRRGAPPQDPPPGLLSARELGLREPRSGLTPTATGPSKSRAPAEGSDTQETLQRRPGPGPQPGGVGLTSALDLFSAIMVNILKVFI